MTVAVGGRGRWSGRRVLFTVGRLPVHSYKVALYLGCVAGVYAGSAMAGARGLDPSRFALTTIGLLVPALAGARLWYAARHADFFRGDRGRLVRRSDGGAGLFGGLVGGVAVSIPVLALVGLPFWAFWDAAVITMLVGLAFTRVGCYMNGCCAGRRSFDAGFAVVALTVAAAMYPLVPTGALFGGVVVLYCAQRGWRRRSRLLPAGC